MLSGGVQVKSIGDSKKGSYGNRQGVNKRFIKNRCNKENFS